MAVAFIPYGQPAKHFCRLADIDLDDVEWRLDDRPEGTCLSDLQATDHIILFADWHALSSSVAGLSCPVSLLLGEPPAIKANIYRAVRWRARNYRYVLAHNTGVLQTLPNARFLAHGNEMVGAIQQPVVEKQHRVSLIASRKKSTKGHRLRHQIIKWASQSSDDFHALGGGYRRFEEKEDGHNPFYFSVVIENSREPGYFTEKLIDCFLCRCLPIYWGAPDIEHFFDSRGMVICSSAEEIKEAIAKLTVEDYQRLEPFLEENRQRAMQHTDLFGRACRLVHDLDHAAV